MSSPASLEIPYGAITNRFDMHISNPAIKRSLVSGPFGSGKSTFLREYFAARPDRYVMIRINPVNYSVSSNDDIFNIVKADILLQFYRQKLASPEELQKLPVEKVWLQYMKRHPLAFSSHMAAALAKVVPFAEKVSGVVEAISALVKDVNEFEKKITEAGKPMGVAATEFVDEVYGSATSVWESSVVAEYIRDIITGQRDSGKCVVLVVDDLDRLDPEHIFRIMNIFSAHMESDTDDNKFGFDKILLVCDYDNIERIYTHRYGEDVDFEGYIDKFLSEERFKFSIHDTVAEYCRAFSNASDPASGAVLQIVLSMCASEGLLTVRQLMKAKAVSWKSFPIIKYAVEPMLQKPLARIQITGLEFFIMISDDVGLIRSVKQLSAIFGSMDKVVEVLEKLERVDREISDADMDWVAKAFYLPILILQKSKNPVEMFFQKYTVGPDGRQLTLENPFMLIGDRHVQLHRNVREISANKDNAESSWFTGSSFTVARGEGSPFKASDLCKLLREFCNFLHRKKYVHMMGISSSY